MGWCKRCHAVCVFGDWRYAATAAYVSMAAVKFEMKPCPLPTRTYSGYGNVDEGDCGGAILELPDQAVLLAAFMIGGPDAVQDLLTPGRIAAVRSPRRW